jgi:hypothetical protein
MSVPPPSKFLVHHEATRAHVLHTIAQAWGIWQPLTHNPAPNPVSLHRRHLMTLTSRYVVAEKTDGVRYLLVLGTCGETPYAVLVDRALTIYQLQVCAPKKMYCGCVFDGELVWDTRQLAMVYYIFDTISFQGISLHLDTFSKRYTVVTDTFVSQSEFSVTSFSTALDGVVLATRFSKKMKIVAIPDDTDDHMLFLYVKQCVTFNLFGSLQRSVKHLGHKSDGFIFTPMDEPIRRGTHTTCFKWKYAPTIDIRVVSIEGGTRYVLQCQRESAIVDLEQALPTLSFVFTIGKGCNLQDNDAIIVEVGVLVRDDTCIECKFHRLRSDKLTANSVQTIQDVIFEVRENITIQDLIDRSSIVTLDTAV